MFYLVFICITRGPSTYVFEPVLAELREEMKESEDGEPRRPTNHFIHVLHVHHTEDEDELVEDEIPELVFQPLKC